MCWEIVRCQEISAWNALSYLLFIQEKSSLRYQKTVTYLEITFKILVSSIQENNSIQFMIVHLNLGGFITKMLTPACGSQRSNWACSAAQSNLTL